MSGLSPLPKDEWRTQAAPLGSQVLSDADLCSSTVTALLMT